MRFIYSGESDKFLFVHSGQHCTIERVLTQAEADIDDVGQMFRVKFRDGFIADVFADELQGRKQYA